MNVQPHYNIFIFAAHMTASAGLKCNIYQTINGFVSYKH